MPKAIVTGACGFIGTCLSLRLMEIGVEVVGIDNLSRPGSELNLGELVQHDLFSIKRVDLSHSARVHDVFSKIGEVDAVFHLAAQVAVTTSYVDRQRDFLDNAGASFNVIESVKRFTPGAYCLYASTNKVYGHIEVAEPVGLDKPLDPYTPYGVSKATGELYFREYGREEVGLKTCALRQSCIYGHHQFGVEDQGWVAWFAIANMLGFPITIYGDGRQVRDLLFVDDLVALYLESWQQGMAGVFPVGGGPNNAISLTEGLKIITEVTGKEFTKVAREDVRHGDQPYFVADLSWTEGTNLTWRPKVSVREGIERLVTWIRLNEEIVSRVQHSL